MAGQARYQRIVAGVAWTFLIISVWASFRLGVTVLNPPEPLEPATLDGRPVLTALNGALMPLLVFNFLVALATLGASIAMLSFKPWTRNYFGVILALTAAYCVVFLYVLVFENNGGASGEWESLMVGLAIGMAIFSAVLAALSAWLSWLFFKSEQLQSTFGSD